MSLTQIRVIQIRINQVCIKMILSILMFIPAFAFAQDLIVIRHGEALSNQQNVMSADPLLSKEYPLTEKGRNQVKKAAEDLRNRFGINNTKIRWVYSSPLLRAEETAEILMTELGIDFGKKVIDYAIKEPSYGILEGRNGEKLRALFPGQNPWNNTIASLYMGEANEDLDYRLQTFINRIKIIHTEGDILVVTHGSPMMTITKILEPGNSAWKPKNAEFRVLKLRQEGGCCGR